jgi:lysophospholipase L1-like esterase
MALLLLCGSAGSARAVPQPMAVISLNAPAYASSFATGYPPGNANGDIYDATDAYSWISTSVPAWIAYDLSGIPASQRHRVDVLWINNVNAYQYDVASGGTPLGLPSDYTIDVNAASGAAPPATGWVTLVNVTGNILKSRQHVIDVSGYKWLRMNVTRVVGGTAVHLMRLDVQDLSQSSSGQPEDSWIYFGDSITLGGLNYFEHYFGSPDDFSFATLIQAQLPNRFPAQEDGGVVGAGIVDAVNHIDGWLATFQGRFVGISYGTNDAAQMAPDPFYSYYATVVQKVLSAGKVPIVPKIPWGKTATVQANVPALNAKIDQLYATFPQIVRGPDLWTLFQQNPGLIQDGDVHPTTDGYGHMKQWWAQAMLSSVYGVQPLSTGEPRPGGFALAITARGPNPSRGGDVWIDFELPSRAPASLELLDMQGRRVLSRQVDSLGPGHHSIDLGHGRRLEPGLYLVRLRQGGETGATRVTVLR